MADLKPRIMTDGTICFPKRGFEPPPVPAGYRRKSNNLRNPDAWIMLPILKPCEHRTTSIEYGECGSCTIIYFCKGDRLYDLSKCIKC